MDKTGRILQDCLDGYSRSRMVLHLNLMYRHGLLKDEDLKQFSEELQERISNLKELWDE